MSGSKVAAERQQRLTMAIIGRGGVDLEAVGSGKAGKAPIAIAMIARAFETPLSWPRQQ